MNVREDAESNQLGDQDRSAEELRLSRWMTLAQGGDSEAYRQLLTELNSMLEKYALSAVKRFDSSGDLAFARDIVQEILLAVHAKRHTYDSNQRFLPWVFGIARHKLVDWQRKHFSEKKNLDFDFEMDQLESPEFSELDVFKANGQPTGNLNSLLEKLNPKQRKVIELTKIEGLTIAETAARTGLSEANVKVLTHRGIASLRKMMEEQHEST